MAKRSERDTATLLFAVLKHAKENNDFERAAEAQKKLQDMGVTVRFSDRQPAAKKLGATPCN
ncbi:MAG: hypothetical protein SH850_00815 [Planctomycetaceae bacterium]|nr:hypothetical protein [Planctomycetaceae bacterium]